MRRVIQRKEHTPEKINQFKKDLKELNKKLDRVEKFGGLLIIVDETTFSYKTQRGMCWAKKG
jgi:hypothetical protein